MSDETPEQIAELAHAFVDECWDPDLTVAQWWARMREHRFVSTTLPVAAGGRGWSHNQAAAADAVLTERRVLGPPSGLGLMLAAPTIAHQGTQEQIDRWVPNILDGTDSWCQLFSEPGAGSDLAGLQCKAERDGDEWIVTGQKVWTSMGKTANWGMLIARTDPDLPKHQGITYFGIRMDQPGVEVRPLTEMTGRAVFNEVFLTEARVSDADIIGGRGNGWRVANATLMFERTSIGGGHGGGYGTASPGPIAGHLEQPVSTFLGHRDEVAHGAIGRHTLAMLEDEARKRGRIDDPVVRQELARLHAMHQVSKLTGRRQAAERKAGRRAEGLGVGVEGNVAKIVNSQILAQAREVACAILGPDAIVVGDGSATAGFLQEMILFSPGPPIYGGTDQIQRNVIGERGLGLPKEPGPSKDTPFSELPKG